MWAHKPRLKCRVIRQGLLGSRHVLKENLLNANAWPHYLFLYLLSPGLDVMGWYDGIRDWREVRSEEGR